MLVVRFARPILQSCILGSCNNLKIRGIPQTKFEYVSVLLELKVQIKLPIMRFKLCQHQSFYISCLEDGGRGQISDRLLWHSRCVRRRRAGGSTCSETSWRNLKLKNINWTLLKHTPPRSSPEFISGLRWLDSSLSSPETTELQYLLSSHWSIMVYPH